MKKFIGTKEFYKMLFIIVVPIILQQFITQFVSLLDNLMIGQIGDSEMTGVSLGNQLLFVFNLTVFGSLAGASIFASQYFGASNKKGYHETVRFKWLMGIIIFIISTVIFLLFNEQLINAFITVNESDSTDPAVVLSTGRTYLLIMLIGNLPFIIKEIYATSLREMKETLFPMISGVVAIIINLVFNYFLIFGKFGFPELGVTGAAIATVLSRFVEMILVITYTHVKKAKFNYFNGVYKHILVKAESIKLFLPRSILLLTNELLWSMGLTIILQCFSSRSLDVVGAFNISNTINNVFITIGTSLGNATGIIIGNLLGAKKEEEAKSASFVILAFAVAVSLIVTGIMIGCSFFVPNLYNASDYIKELARDLIIINAIALPFQAFNTCCYFILRAGGKVMLTMFFDCFYIWLIRLPVAFILCYFTKLDVRIVFTLCWVTEMIKSFVGYILVNKGIWLKTMV